MKPFLPFVATTLTLALLGGCSPADAGKTVATVETTPALSVTVATAAGVTLRKTAPAHIADTLTLYGVITPDAFRTQEVSARYAGMVRQLKVKPGDTVRQGSVLLTVESSDSLASYPVRAAINGTVLSRQVNPGAIVEAGRPLLVVSDLSSVWAEFHVFAHDLARIRAGMTVQVADAYDQSSGTSQIDFVAPAGDADSQSVVARATLDNGDNRWTPGQFLAGHVRVAERDAAITVAPQALQQLDGKTVVFVQEGDHFTAREVRPGLRDEQAVEIVAGLDANVTYAADNSYLIKADLLKHEGGED
jgi:cobalt-zinc-cadmium efflux system membrane fusion protein